MRAPEFTELEQVIAQATTSECIALIGELERLKAAAWIKMLACIRPTTTNHVESGEQLLTVAQVAARLNVKESFVYEICRRGKLTSVRMGKYVRISKQALAKYQMDLERH